MSDLLASSAWPEHLRWWYSLQAGDGHRVRLLREALRSQRRPAEQPYQDDEAAALFSRLFVAHVILGIPEDQVRRLSGRRWPCHYSAHYWTQRYLEECHPLVDEDGHQPVDFSELGELARYMSHDPTILAWADGA